ncbi:MAG TPA: hypothetical protein VKQ27_08825 [Acetobacteraceae bacterium]|nr:hypothetical protein [Acetobacteraceae bacterium]
MKLLIMSCCATKRPNPAPMPAIDRYDGPMWQTLRARLAELPAAVAAMRSGELVVRVLSAQHGFIPVDIAILPYEQRLTSRRADDLLSMCTSDHAAIADVFAEAEAVMFAGGALYRDTMWRASRGGLAQIMKVSETDGAGIGEHRAQLGDWLGVHFPCSERGLAA